MLKKLLIILLITFCLQLVFAQEPTETEEKLLENQEEMLDNQEEIIENQEEMLEIIDSKRGFKNRDILNVMSMPTAYTLNKNEFILGIGPIYYGITDRVQIGTNLLLFIVQDRNVRVKTNLYKASNLAFAAGVNYDYFAMNVFGSDIDFSFLSPYAAVSLTTSEKMTLHFSGQYSTYWSDVDSDIEDADSEWYSQGTSGAIGFDISASHRTKFIGEFAYDSTFEGTRMGGAVLFGWEKFRLKLGLNMYNYVNLHDVIMPSISLWWRFSG